MKKQTYMCVYVFVISNMYASDIQGLDLRDYEALWIKTARNLHWNSHKIYKSPPHYLKAQLEKYKADSQTKNMSPLITRSMIPWAYIYGLYMYIYIYIYIYIGPYIYMKYILTVGICSTPSSYSLSLWICVQRELSRSLVVDDSVLVPRNLTRILTPSASNHSGKSDVTFAITEVLPAPGSPHITTGALKFKCRLIHGFCERGGSPIVFTIDAFANHCQITLLVTKKS